MRVARSILMVVIVAALSAYSVDCSLAATPEEAMRCCDTMSCSSHGHHHSNDCCKTMPSTHSPFVQSLSSSSSMDNEHVTLVLGAFLPAGGSFQDLDFSAQTLLVARSHAPPILQSTVIAPLRI